MAHAAPDFVIDRDDNETFLNRDDKWFRANCSRSATPETQRAEIIRERRIVYTNSPDRTKPNASQLAVDAAHALVFPTLLRPDVGEARRNIGAIVNPPVVKLAMHGGAGVGERFMRPRARLQPIKFASPEFGREACSETRRDARRATEVIVKSQGHAIALRAVERGVAERKALDDLRAAAKLRRGE